MTLKTKEPAEAKTITERERDNMTDQAREARRQYKREWNRKNRDKVKAAQARYWERKAQAAQDQATDAPSTQEE